MKIEHKTDLKLTKVLSKDLEIGDVFMYYPDGIENILELHNYNIFIKTDIETKFCLFDTIKYNYSPYIDPDEECLKLDTTLTINNYL